MPRNGSGAYALPNGPFVPSTVISSTTMNQNFNDIGTAITQSISNDGQTTPVANLPMATFRHTNVGNAVARNDYAAAGQVQDSSLQWLTSVAGTNTITASITPSPTAYTAGQTFRFTAANANTGATTLNINGLGAKSIFKRGTLAIAAGDIAAGGVYEVVYDGTNFQLANASFPSGALINVQVLTASGNYTPTAGTNRIVFEIAGGGGAGGGRAATAAGQISMGGGGGAGGRCVSSSNSGFSGSAFTIGAGGVAVSGAAGGNGGNSTFLGVTAGGGAGGVTSGPAAAPFGNTNTATGGTASGANILNTPGDPGTIGFGMSNTNPLAVFSGGGGNSLYGGGGRQLNASSGTANGTGFGSGGGGIAAAESFGAAAGGNGAPGVLVIYEYA